jgi:HSP20 family protein
VINVALPVRHADRDVDGGRRDLFAGLDTLNRQLSSYLDSWRQLPDVLTGAFTPFGDVEETPDAYVVEIELPGIRKDDLDIALAGRRVTVTGERRERERIGILRRRERVVGRFHYEVTLPGELDEDGVEAHLDEGVLTIRVPKAESERPRRIPVH